MPWKITCRTCHFLNSGVVIPGSSSPPYDHIWSADERWNGELSKPYKGGAGCAKGIWYEAGHAVDVPAEIDKRRGNSCHWIEYSPSMSYPAAEKLLEHRKYQRDVTRQWVRIGIALAGLCLAILLFVFRMLETSEVPSPW